MILRDIFKQAMNIEIQKATSIAMQEFIKNNSMNRNDKIKNKK